MAISTTSQHSLPGTALSEARDRESGRPEEFDPNVIDDFVLDASKDPSLARASVKLPRPEPLRLGDAHPQDWAAAYAAADAQIPKTVAPVRGDPASPADLRKRYVAMAAIAFVSKSVNARQINGNTAPSYSQQEQPVSNHPVGPNGYRSLPVTPIQSTYEAYEPQGVPVQPSQPARQATNAPMFRPIQSQPARQPQRQQPQFVQQPQPQVMQQQPQPPHQPQSQPHPQPYPPIKQARAPMQVTFALPSADGLELEIACDDVVLVGSVAKSFLVLVCRIVGQTSQIPKVKPGAKVAVWPHGSPMLYVGYVTSFRYHLNGFEHLLIDIEQTAPYADEADAPADDALAHAYPSANNEPGPEILF